MRALLVASICSSTSDSITFLHLQPLVQMRHPHRCCRVHVPLFDLAVLLSESLRGLRATALTLTQEGLRYNLRRGS